MPLPRRTRADGARPDGGDRYPRNARRRVLRHLVDHDEAGSLGAGLGGDPCCGWLWGQRGGRRRRARRRGGRGRVARPPRAQPPRRPRRGRGFRRQDSERDHRLRARQTAARRRRVAARAHAARRTHAPAARAVRPPRPPDRLVVEQPVQPGQRLVPGGD